MKFKGNLIITDPKFLSKDSDWGRIFSPSENKIPLKTFILGEGKITATVYQLKDESISPKQFSEDLSLSFLEYNTNPNLTNQIIYSELLNSTKPLGTFTTESGYFIIALEEEILSYYPKFYSETDIPSFCYATISDYSGDIEIFKDKYDRVHILGDHFITSDSDLNNQLTL